MTLAINEMFLVTPSDSALQIPPYAQAGPLRVLYNDTATEGLISVVVTKDGGSTGNQVAYNVPAGTFLKGIGEIVAVLATGTAVTRILGAQYDDQTP